MLLTQYLAVFGAAMADAGLPVLPGEVVVVALAAGAGGLLERSAVVGSAAAGSFAGQVSVFSLARAVPERHRVRWSSRLGLRRLPGGWLGALAAAFLPAGRLSLAAGSGLDSRPWRRFLPLALGSALIGALWLGGVGQLVAGVAGGRGLVTTAVAVAAAVLVCLAGSLRSRRRPARRRSARRRRPSGGPRPAPSCGTPLPPRRGRWSR